MPADHDVLTIAELGRALKMRRGMAPLRVGTRASPLALAQTESFLAHLRALCPFLRDFQVLKPEAFETTGDAIQDRRLAEIGGKGLFAKEIHEALLAGTIDLAVHSLKDLETPLPEGILLACVLPREDARDVLVLGPRLRQAAGGDAADPFALLPQGAVIGTSSVRRQAQLLARRPDLEVRLLRGNVGTRLAKLERGEADATLLARAGLVRLGLVGTVPHLVLGPEEMVPAAGQGIIGVTVRSEDHELAALLAAVEDRAARAVATAEREMLAALDGSCRTPIGGYARIEGEALVLTGLVARADGSFHLKRTEAAPPAEAARLGRALGEALREAAPPDIFAADIFA
jgi:hydroxymethylbilane synthase